MENALRNVARHLGAETVEAWRDRLERAQGMPSAAAKFDRIAGAPDRRRLEDTLAEILFALVFAGFGLDVEFQPPGGPGPDLLVSRGGRDPFGVEVVRLSALRGSGGAGHASDPSGFFLELVDRFQQAGGMGSVLAVWGDESGADQETVAQELASLCADAARRASLPEDVSYVLYGARWISPGAQLLKCFRVLRG